MFRTTRILTHQSWHFQWGFDYIEIPSTHFLSFLIGKYQPLVIISAGHGTRFIVFNQNPNAVPEPKLSWFSDVKLRQALAHALDKETILDMAMNGQGYILDGPSTCGMSSS